MNRFRSTAILFALIGLLGITTGTAGADLLVTRDGITLETSGPWRVEGRQVIFTLPGGALSSIRADRVDLDQSAIATERSHQQAIAPEPEPAVAPALLPPVMRIDDKDVTPPPPVVEDENENDEGEAPTSSSSGPLEVASWDKIELAGGDGVEIFGTLRNNGIAIVSAPSVTVFVYGAGGGLLATSDGNVNLTSIPPGKSANFRAPLPGLHDFAAIKFDVTGRGYTVQETSEAVAAEPGEEGLDDTGERSADAAGVAASEENADVDPGAQYDNLPDDSNYDESEDPAGYQPATDDEQIQYDDSEEASADDPPARN